MWSVKILLEAKWPGKTFLILYANKGAKDHRAGSNSVEVHIYNHKCMAFEPQNVKTDYPFMAGFGLSYFLIVLSCVCVCGFYFPVN